MKINEIFVEPISHNESSTKLFLVLADKFDDVCLYADRLENFITHDSLDSNRLKLACNYYNILSIMTMNAKLKAEKEKRYLNLSEHDEHLQTIYYRLIELGGRKYL